MPKGKTIESDMVNPPLPALFQPYFHPSKFIQLHQAITLDGL
tara:strand:+ start:78077 stop:78202 length:126 start_codon:yes stop_codon:yes gene_type:complete